MEADESWDSEVPAAAFLGLLAIVLFADAIRRRRKTAKVVRMVLLG